MRHASFRAAMCAVILSLGMTAVAGAVEVSGTHPGAASSHGIARASFSASGALTFGTSTAANAAPAEPSASASLSTWQSWENKWNASLNTTDIDTSFTSAGCTVVSDTVKPMTVAGAQAVGFPKGIVPDGGYLVVNCSHSTLSAFRHSHSTPCIQECGAYVTNGYQDTYDDCDQGGVTNTMCSYFDYTGAPTDIYGHVELSSDGAEATTCSVGSLIQNMSPHTSPLYDDEITTAYDPVAPTGSDVFNGNFWEGTGSPYTNYGNVCASI